MSKEIAENAGSVKFLQYEQPGLTAGNYEIAVSQVVSIKAKQVSALTAEQSFTVAGERFELNPTDIHSVFPPDGNLGDHTNVLPHIILGRSTLPWERMAEAHAAEKDRLPWLALLLFDEEDKPTPETLTLGKLRENPKDGDPKFPRPLKLEKGQHDEDMVTIIDVPCDVLQKIMPAAEELKMLAHVRFGTDTPKGEELAVIISNRLPRSNKSSTAHLVSLEGRFTNPAGEYSFNYQGAFNKDLVRLVSLKSWSFTCESPKKSFQQLLVGLNKDAEAGARATLRLPQGVRDAERFVSQGYVPLPHYFRYGDQTASWFRGPLIPGKNKNTSQEMHLPARTGDELVRYDSEVAMFDVSYGAAWELGRLLALQDKKLSVSLYQWKRRHAQRRAQGKQLLHRLPFQRQTPADLPEDISSWFEGLRKLNGVPFNYLVPDERMLPAESIRFFRVDQVWLDCLADGAFSIGRVASSDHKADKLLGHHIPAASTEQTWTGILLRSELVSGWPGLHLDAYPTQDSRRLPVVRMERLAAGVLLCIFEGELDRLEFYLKPETLHFGLDMNGTGFHKKLREPDSGKPRNDKVGSIPWRSDRTVNVTLLAESINGILKLPKFTSAQFAIQMVEGADKVIFRPSKV